MCHAARSLFYLKTAFNKEAAGLNCLTRRMPFNANNLTVAVRANVLDSSCAVVSLLKFNKNGRLMISLHSFIRLPACHTHRLGLPPIRFRQPWGEAACHRCSRISKNCSAQELQLQVKLNCHICPRRSRRSVGVLRNFASL